MPLINIPRGKVCAITFESRNAPDEPAQTIIGTYTGEIDSWGKRTIQLLDSAAGGPYYLFADEVLACEVCSAAEVAAERAGIYQQRLERALGLLRAAKVLLEGAETGQSFAVASAIANAGQSVQQAAQRVEHALWTAGVRASQGAL